MTQVTFQYYLFESHFLKKKTKPCTMMINMSSLKSLLIFLLSWKLYSISVTCNGVKDKTKDRKKHPCGLGPPSVWITLKWHIQVANIWSFHPVKILQLHYVPQTCLYNPHSLRVTAFLAVFLLLWGSHFFVCFWLDDMVEESFLNWSK